MHKKIMLMIAAMVLMMAGSLLAASTGSTPSVPVTRYIWDHPRYNIAYVDVEHGLKEAGRKGRSYTVETKMGEAICYFRGVEKSMQGNTAIAENRDGCKLSLEFGPDRSSVTVSIAGGNCAICGEGMNLEGTYQRYKTYNRELPAAPAPSPTTKMD